MLKEMMQNNRFYILKHKDQDVCILELNAMSGKIVSAQVLNVQYMPNLGNPDIQLLMKWWDHRAIPQNRPELIELLKQNQCQNAEQYMVKNLALSMTDAYWICPDGIDLRWKDVNLYTHHEHTIEFHSVDGMNYSTRNATLGGSLDKRIVYDADGPELHKSSETLDGQQSINEAFASLVHKNQGFKNYIAYGLSFDEEHRCSACICPLFTNEKIEYVPAYELVSSEKKPNSMSMFEFYIHLCVKHGISEDVIRKQMDYMILSDYLMTNTDRHFENFGLLRNSDTMEMIAPAPLFDSGNAMFYKDAYGKSRVDLAETQVNSFTGFEWKMLSYVSDKAAIDLSKMPDQTFTQRFYETCGIRKEKARTIAANYQTKSEMLRDFQRGISISLYHEKQKEKEVREVSSYKTLDELLAEINVNK